MSPKILKKVVYVQAYFKFALKVALIGLTSPFHICNIHRLSELLQLQCRARLCERSLEKVQHMKCTYLWAGIHQASLNQRNKCLLYYTVLSNCCFAQICQNNTVLLCKCRGAPYLTVQTRYVIFLKHKQSYCLATDTDRENISDVNTYNQKPCRKCSASYQWGWSL